MHVGVTLTQIQRDRADTRWENEEGNLSESLLNPTWQMPNLQEVGSEDKTGKANAQIFLDVVKDKGNDVILFFFFHLMSI